MPVAIDEFWDLAVQSQLATADEAEQLRRAFGRVRGAAEQANAVTLAEWLVATGVLSRYQARVLLAGRPGPFTFGCYRVVDRVESGRLAKLLQGVHAPTGHTVLLYPLAGPAAADERKTALIAAQTRQAAALVDEHLLRVNELAGTADQKFLVLERLAGKSLSESLAADRPSPADACRIAQSVALGLAKLNAAGMVHADVSPANVWLDESGAALLLRFPLARSPLAGPVINPTVATPSPHLAAMADYLAPELCRAAQNPTPASDVYSLGCVLYEMLAGRPPFSGGDVAQKLQRHASQLPPALPIDVPLRVGEVVNRMLAKSPADRIASAALVAEALRPLAAPARQRKSSATRRAYERQLAGAAAPEPFRPIVVGVGEIATLPARQVAAAEFQLNIDAPRGSSPVLLRPRRKANPWVLAGGVSLAAIALVIAVAVANYKPAGPSQVAGSSGALAVKPAPTHPEHADQDLAKSPPPTAPEPRQTARSPQVASVRSPAPPTGPAVVEVDDDEKTLWVSPTSGPPLSLKHLPLGGKLFLALRPAEIMKHSEGERILDGFGPGGKAALDAAARAIGFSLRKDPVEQLIVAFYPQDAAQPLAAFVVRLAEPATEADLLKRWGNPRSGAEAAKGKVFLGSQWAYFVPSDGQRRVFAVMPPAEVATVAAAEEAPPLRREMAALLAQSDAARHATLLVAPNFLFSEGKALLAGNAESLAAPLGWWLGDGIQATLVSFHLDKSCFAEMRVFGTLDRTPLALARTLADRLGEAPQKVEDYIVSLDPHPYGRKILFRFPGMIRQLQRYTRVGEEGQQAVLRSYLPSHAAHNLAMGVELALAERPGAAPSVTANGTANQAAVPQTVAQSLAKRISLSFDKDSLEKALEAISKEIDVEIKILGSDLQLDGITRNQPLTNVNEHDKPASEILRAMLLKARPDGKLIYVIKPKAPGEKEIVFITTRTEAAKRNDPIPPELAAAPKKK